jgi:hypothetical protein
MHGCASVVSCTRTGYSDLVYWDNVLTTHRKAKFYAHMSNCYLFFRLENRKALLTRQRKQMNQVSIQLGVIPHYMYSISLLLLFVFMGQYHVDELHVITHA